MAKKYRVTVSRPQRKDMQHEGTLEELIQCFSHTLAVGVSWEHEKGNKKINRNPKSIKALVTALYNAKNNAANNGYSGYSYSYEVI